jgi:uncharacterized membrane protein
MREILTGYLTAALVMAGLDFLWLRLMVEPVYQPVIGSVLAEKPNMAAAVGFYVIYLIGVTIFAIRPALQSGDWRTGLFYGALFGFFAYATYDLTNMATLKIWSLKITLIDMAWGTVLTATAAGGGALGALAVQR